MQKIIFILSLLTLFLNSNADVRTIQISPDIQLVQLCENIYLHKSFTNSEIIGRFPSNGLLLIKNNKALMIDTPMLEEETKKIVAYLRDSMHCAITTFIGGHFHNDCIGGMEYLKSLGVTTILGSKTKEECITHNLPLPNKTFDNKLDFSFEGTPIECRYFGGGHTEDNIVVYLPEFQLLFGGCLVKSMQSNGIGNTSDAVIGDWVSTIEKVVKAYPEVSVVIPGHGAYGNNELLNHTIEIVRNYQSQ